MIKLFFILFYLAIVLSVAPMLTRGEAMGRRPDYKEEIKEKFKKIDSSDGVSEEEAVIIAQNHIITNIKDKIFDLKST